MFCSNSSYPDRDFQPFGYLSSALNENGEYTTPTLDISQAMLVELTYEPYSDDESDESDGKINDRGRPVASTS